MPQLNPAPWFGILVMSWLVFLLVLMPKTMAHTFPKEPAPQNAKTIKPQLWDWPWH